MSLKRLDALPDVPPVADFVPGFETSAFAGLAAPKDTPAEIIDMINKGVNAGLADPKVATRIIELGGMPMPLSPEGFGKHVAEETEKWAKVVKVLRSETGLTWSA